MRLSIAIWSLLVMTLAGIWRWRCDKDKKRYYKKTKTKDIVRHLVGFVANDALLLWTAADWKSGE